MSDCANCLGTVYEPNTNGLCADCLDDYRDGVLGMIVGGK